VEIKHIWLEKGCTPKMYNNVSIGRKSYYTVVL